MAGDLCCLTKEVVVLLDILLGMLFYLSFFLLARPSVLLAEHFNEDVDLFLFRWHLLWPLQKASAGPS